MRLLLATSAGRFKVSWSVETIGDTGEGAILPVERDVDFDRYIPPDLLD